jgi:hypothetical protein
MPAELKLLSLAPNPDFGIILFKNNQDFRSRLQGFTRLHSLLQCDENKLLEILQEAFDEINDDKLNTRYLVWNSQIFSIGLMKQQ